MKRLTVEQIIQLHQALIEKSGGLAGLRDRALLESSANTPFMTFDGCPVYPTLLAKAARLGYALVKNHAFVDGNKRVGVLAMVVFLEINGVQVQCTDSELVSLGLGLADGSIDDTALLQWLVAHC